MKRKYRTRRMMTMRTRQTKTRKKTMMKETKKTRGTGGKSELHVTAVCLFLVYGAVLPRPLFVSCVDRA